MPQSAGEHLGPYEILASIGSGGMGEVYRARDTRLGRAVAVKIINEKFSARFEHEARCIAALSHPHICAVFDVGPNYLVMELLEGETLAARLKGGALPIDQVSRYGIQIADALATAHAQGIVHRDLKPGNIMITKSGVKVLDFGLAKTMAPDQTLTLTNTVMGTPAYMAPEQLEGDTCDARTDIYAQGLVLYEMATGKRFRKDQPLSLAVLPSLLAHVVENCLAHEPEQRWHSAADLKLEMGRQESAACLCGGSAVAIAKLLACSGGRCDSGLCFFGVASLRVTANDQLPVQPIRHGNSGGELPRLGARWQDHRLYRRSKRCQTDLHKERRFFDPSASYEGINGLHQSILVTGRNTRLLSFGSALVNRGRRWRTRIRDRRRANGCDISWKVFCFCPGRRGKHEPVDHVGV